MTLIGQIDPLNYASLKPAFAASQEEAASRVQQQVAQVQLTNAQDEQQRNQAFRVRQAVVAKAPSVEAYTELLAVAPKEYVEGLKASIAQMDTAARKTLADQVVSPWISGANGRPDLMIAGLEEQAAGFESKGMKDKAAGVRQLIAIAEKNPDEVTARLGATYLEAAGPEKFKALVAAQNLGTERRKKLADAILAEANADPKKTDAALREQLAKAKREEALAGTAEELAAAQLKTAQIEAEFKRQQETQRLATASAQEKQSLSGMRHTDFLADKGKKTLDSDIAESEAKARKEKALATKAEGEITPEAIQARKEEDQARVKKIKQEAETLRTQAVDLPTDMRKESLDSVKASMKSFADVTRIRKLADDYGKIPKSAGAGYGARFNQWVRGATGKENKLDDVYRMAEQVVKMEVLNEAQAIRPVSDTDMAILRGDKPTATSNPAYVARYLNALGSAREAQAKVEQGTSAWINAFRGPYSADEDKMVMGEKVAAGTSMADFLNRRNNPYMAMSPEELAPLIAAEKAARKAAGK